MNTNFTQSDFHPNYNVHPGEILADILDNKSLSQKELADRINKSEKTISEIVNGKSPITPETAIQFEQALNVPATFWNNLEKNYQQFIASTQNRTQLESEVQYLSKYPIKELVKRGIIKEFDSKIDQVIELLTFLGVTSFENVSAVNPVAFRTHRGDQIKPENIVVWLRIAELQAEKVNLNPFDESKLKNQVTELRALTKETPEVFIPKLINILNSCGIVLIFTEYLPNTLICGASRWLSPTKALIQLSLKGNSADSMWFTLFHELAHLILHSKKEEYIDLEPSENAIKSTIEDQADAWASEQLIPNKYVTMYQTMGQLTDESILKYAGLVNIDVGIFVGRLQKLGILKYSEFRNFQKSYDIKIFEKYNPS